MQKNNNYSFSDELGLVSEYHASIGRKGGLKGGMARAQALSPSKRKAIAQKAAKARWSKKQV